MTILLPRILNDDPNYQLFNENLFIVDHDGPSASAGIPINLTCPHYGRAGAFSQIPAVSDVRYHKNGGKPGSDKRQSVTPFEMGIRICPNTECRGFVAYLRQLHGAKGQRLCWVAPPQLISFDQSSIPKKLAESLEEAVASHSVQAYRASALMVRRTLELLCVDRGAQGNNLAEKIGNLSQFATLPPALLEAAKHLRILGNDAAHVEAKEYEEVGPEHSEAAIELTKEILKAVYQLDDLVSRLKKLGKSNPAS